MGHPIYVECRIRAPLSEIWRLTQSPELHERWDLRFTSIRYLPRPDPARPQQFLYETRIGFGLRIRGEGESVGERQRDGSATSALKFWSNDPKSLIREGSGYWQYAETPEGVRFLTQYDYRVRFGLIGRIFDTACFRPLMSWATAWSFDRLRLWLEQGIDPSLSMLRSVVNAACRVALGAIWLYQGIVPKLVLAHEDEFSMLRSANLWPGGEGELLRIAGVSEVILGLAVLIFWRRRWPLVVTVAALAVLGAGAAAAAPGALVAPFNPASLSVAMIALATLGLVACRDLPMARRCLRAKPEKEA